MSNIDNLLLAAVAMAGLTTGPTAKSIRHQQQLVDMAKAKAKKLAKKQVVREEIRARRLISKSTLNQ